MDQGYCEQELVRDDTGRAIDHRYLEVNPAFERIFGIPAAEFRGRRVTEMFPGVEDIWTQTHERVVRTRKPERMEHRVAQLDRWFEAFTYPTHGDRYVVLFDDVTERKQAEERQAFLLKLSDALRAEPDADAVANRAMQMLIQQMGVDRSYIFSWNLQDDVGYVTHQVGNDRAPALPPVIRPSGFPASVRVSAEGTLVIDDIFEHPNLSDRDRVNIAGLGMRALVSATLRKWEQPLWSMVAVSAEPRHWTQGEIKLVEEVAERTWAAVEQARAEDALRESEARYRTLFETMGQGYCDLELVRDATGRAVDQQYLALNPAFERLFGISVERAVGRRRSELFPDLEPRWQEAFDRVAHSGVPERIEHEEPSLGRWYEMWLYPRGGDQLTVLYEEMTERKRREFKAALLTEIGKN